MFCLQVLVEGFARVVDHQGEGARGARLAARDVVAIRGFDVVGNARAGCEHGGGGFEQSGAAHGSHALWVLE